MNNLKIDKQNVTSFILNHIFEFLVIVMIITLSFTASGFLSTTNILGIFRNMALAGVIAYGMMMAIICGEIDLSVPSTVALTGIVIGLFCEYLPAYGIPEWLCVVLGILTMLIFAALIGTFINFLVYRFKMPAFVASMAVMYIIYGFAAVISNGFPVTTFPSWYNAIGAGLILGIPVPAIITLVMFGVTLFLLKYTKFGRSIYAIGGNSEPHGSMVLISSVQKDLFLSMFKSVPFSAASWPLPRSCPVTLTLAKAGSLPLFPASSSAALLLPVEKVVFGAPS